MAVIPISCASGEGILVDWLKQATEGHNWIPLDASVWQDVSNFFKRGVETYNVATASEREVSIPAVESQSARPRSAVWEAVQAFREILHDVEGVEGILGNQTAEGLILTVVMNNPPREHRREIYDREWKLMQRYSDAGFDFHLIDRRDRPLCDVISIELSDIYVRG